MCAVTHLDPQVPQVGSSTEESLTVYSAAASGMPDVSDLRSFTAVCKRTHDRVGSTAKCEICFRFIKQAY